MGCVRECWCVCECVHGWTSGCEWESESERGARENLKQKEENQDWECLTFFVARWKRERDGERECVCVCVWVCVRENESKKERHIKQKLKWVKLIGQNFNPVRRCMEMFCAFKRWLWAGPWYVDVFVHEKRCVCKRESMCVCVFVCVCVCVERERERERESGTMKRERLWAAKKVFVKESRTGTTKTKRQKRESSSTLNLLPSLSSPV